MTAEIIGFDPPLATVGSKIAFQVEIANRGTGAFAGSIELQFILEATIQGVLTTIPIAHRSVVTIDSLAHGATARQGVKDVQIPKDIAPHIYSVKMRLDPDNLIQEDSESNNESTTPNLIVQGFRLTGSTLRLADHTPEAGVAVDVYRISDLISSVKGIVPTSQATPVGSSVSDASGDFTIHNLPWGTMGVIARKPDWQFFPDGPAPAVPLIFYAADTIQLDKDTDEKPFLGTKKIIIREVRTQFPTRQYFLTGVDLNVDLIVTIDWGSHPRGEILLDAPGLIDWPTEVEDSRSGDNITYKIPLNVGKIDGNGELVVSAKGADGANPEKKIKAPFIVMPSFWQPASFSASKTRTGFFSATGVRYMVNLAVKENLCELFAKVVTEIKLPYVGYIESELVCKVVQLKPELKTEVDGPKASIELVPLVLTAELDSRKLTNPKTWLKPRVQGGLAVPLVLGGEGEYTGTEWRWKATAGFNVELGIGGALPIPELANLVFFRLDGKGAREWRWVNSGSWTSALDFEFWDSSRWERKVDKLTFAVKGGGGVGITDILEAEFWGKIEFEGNDLASLTRFNTGYFAWGWGWCLLGCRDLEWGRIEFGKASPARAAADPRISLHRLRPIPRDYAGRSDHNTFLGGNLSRAQLASPENPPPSSLQPLELNVYPLSQASVSSRNGKAFAAWVTDDPKRSPENRTVVVASRFDGTRWTPPTPIADDGTPDFSPSVRLFDSGAAVAVWQNAGTTLSPGTGITNTMAAMEIAAAIWNPGSGSWSAPVQLTRNSHIDQSPRITGDTPDDLLVVWLANPDNDLLGSPTRPTEILGAHWNGQTWSDPMLIARVPLPILKFDVVYVQGTGHLVLSAQASGQFTKADDRELFATDLANGRWSELRRLTNDAVPDEAPQLGRDQAGHWVLVWLKGNQLLSVSDFDFAHPSVVLDSGYSANLGGYRLARADNGRLGVLWIQPGEHAADVWATFYDPSTFTWGRQKTLTSDPEVERGLAAAWIGDDTILALFDRSLPAEATIAIPDPNGTPKSLPVLTPGNVTDLYSLTYRLHGDVEVRDSRFEIIPSQPAPGDSAEARAIVHNAGDLTAQDLEVALFDGDPAVGGVELGRTKIVGAFSSGAEQPVSISWKVSPQTRPMTLHLVVDPQSLFPDAVRLNNFAVQPFGFPDLGIDRLAWIRTNAQDLVVIASVHNHGLASSAPASIEFRRSDTGVKIGEAGIRAIPGDGVLEVGISMPAPPLDVGIEIDAVILHPAGTTGDDPANDHGHVVIEPGLAHTVIAGIVRISGGDFLVTLTGEMNVHYVLEASQDFRAWTEVDSANGNDSTMALRDPAGRSTPSRFYRVLSSVATPLKP